MNLQRKRWFCWFQETADNFGIFRRKIAWEYENYQTRLPEVDPSLPFYSWKYPVIVKKHFFVCEDHSDKMLLKEVCPFLLQKSWNLNDFKSRTFVATFCHEDLYTFSAEFFGLKIRICKLFRFLDVCCWNEYSYSPTFKTHIIH